MFKINQIDELKDKKVMEYISWGAVIIIILSNIVARANVLASGGAYDVFFVTLSCFAWLHGYRRYGLRNMLVWFGITWVVSLSFEALSIRTGFPFGNYHYSDMGFAILDVPTAIMWSYFSIAYTSWTVAQSLIGVFNKEIKGINKFILPMTTAFVMCMFDLVTDPKDATISKYWIWENGGDYFGVPILNFFGWVLTVYVFMQIFTMFITNKKINSGNAEHTNNRSYWVQAGVVFLSCGLGIVLEGFTQVEHIEIYRNMGLISVFTVVFVSYISILNTMNNKDLIKSKNH